MTPKVLTVQCALVCTPADLAPIVSCVITPRAILSIRRFLRSLHAADKILHNIIEDEAKHANRL